jgi:hypothetical protein
MVEESIHIIFDDKDCDPKKPNLVEDIADIQV